MAAKVGSLYAEITADDRKFSSALAAAGVRVRGFENKTNQSFKRLDTTVTGVLGRMAGGLAAAFSAREVARLIDTSTRISNSLKVAGLRGDELETVYRKLYAAAQKNAVPVEILAQLYGKASQAQAELGVTSEDLIKFSDNVALALRVAGTDATAASGALLQLGQALGSGKVQAEEFNSILEGAPTIAQAVARGLTEAGGSVSKLKGLVVDGKISSEAFFAAFQAGAVSLENAAASSTLTTAQSMTKLGNALVNVAREFDSATGTSEKFATAMDGVADAIGGIDVAGFIAKIREAHAELKDILNTAGNHKVFKALAAALGVTDADGNILNPDVSEAATKIAGLEREVALLQERIELNSSLGFDNTEALARLSEVQAALNSIRASAADMPATVSGLTVGDNGIEAISGTTNGQMGGSTSRGGARRAEVVPVSIADFKAPVGKSSGGGGSKKNDYQRQVEQIREATDALRMENEVLAQVSATTGDYEAAQAKARAEADLLIAAQKAGLNVTPELRASISDLASAYAAAETESRRLAQSQEDAARAAEDFRNGAQDVTRGFIDDLRAGKSAAEAFESALDKIIDKLLDAALDGLFSSPTTGGGGIFGTILSGIGALLGFDGGGWTGPGAKKEPKGVVHGDEFVFTKEATQNAGVESLYALMDYLETGNIRALAANENLPGYDDGGFVGTASLPSLPSSAAQDSGAWAAAGGRQSMSQERGLDIKLGWSRTADGQLRPFIEEVSRRESASVVQAGLTKYDEALPGKISDTMERTG